MTEILTTFGSGFSAAKPIALRPFFEHRHGAVEIGARDGEGEVGGAAVLRDVLHDHVDIDRMVGERAEDGRRDARPVGHLLHGDLGFVAAVRDAAHNLLFHDLVFVDHQGSGGIGKARQHLHAHPVVHRHLDRARLQHLGALRRHLQHFFVGDSIELARFRNDARIGRVDAVDIGEDIAAIGFERRRERHGGGVGAAAAERRDPPARPDPLKPRDDRDLTLGQAAAHLGDVDRLDARLAVHAVGADRDLPAEPRARIDPEILQGQRKQPGGHLLARRDHDIVFARVMQAARLARPVDQLVGHSGHRRDDDGHLVAGVDFALDAPRDVLDPRDIGDRGAAELLNDARHAFSNLSGKSVDAGPRRYCRGRAAPHTLFRSSGHRANHSTEKDRKCAQPAPRSTRRRSNASPRTPRRGGIRRAASAHCTGSTPLGSTLSVNT